MRFADADAPKWRIRLDGFALELLDPFGNLRTITARVVANPIHRRTIRGTGTVNVGSTLRASSIACSCAN
jgi:hypothetical protein